MRANPHRSPQFGYTPSLDSEQVDGSMNPSSTQDVLSPELPLARYRFRFGGDGAAIAALRKQYLGSAWRGAFGTALRRTACVTRLPVCDSCVLLRSCPYPFLFESRTPPGATKLTKYPSTPGPYVLTPASSDYDTAEQTLNLGVTLFGKANDQLPYVAHALDQAAQRGLTRERVALELVDIQTEDHDGTAAGGGWTTIFEPGGHLSPTGTESPAPGAFAGTARVRLLSPLRLRRNNRLVGAPEFDFPAFVGALIRRISLLTYFFAKSPLETDFAGMARAAEGIAVRQRDLHWQEWARYSTRQQAKIPMGGIVGSFELSGPELAPFWPYLWLGQWTQAGRGCSMGLGRYVLEPANTAENASQRPMPRPAPIRL